ncbi:MAG: hypothetical protein M1837_002209 [Sclerophora amabilis]|nr:MAG: hypothetical protein M1837_002209 [Sclerophora amabilis]
MAHNHNHHSHRRGPNRLRQIREALPDLMVEDGQLVEREAQNKATVVSVVYVTAAKTFKGPVAGYTTISPTKGKPLQRGGSDDAATAPTAQAQSEQQTPSRQQSPPPQSPSSVPAASTSRSRVPPTSRPSPSTTQRTSSSSASASRSASRPQSSSERSSLPSSIRAPKSSLESSASLMAADPTSSLSSPSEAESLAAGPTSSPSATAQPVGTSSGMTTAGKAGLAIGIIVGLGLILGLILVCLRRRSKKNEAYGKTEDEKKGFAGDGGAFGAGGGAGSVRSTRTASTAPRLSLRPVTQFSPVLDESRKSAANLLAVSGGGAGEAAADPALASQRNLTPSPQTAGGHWDRQRAVRSDANNSPVNPFGAHAEQTQAPPPGAALGDPSTSSPPLNHSAPSDIRAGHAIAPGVTGAAAGAAAARKVANHQDSPKPLDLTREFDSRPVSPVEARRAPSPTGTMNSFMTATSTGVPHGPVATLTGGPAPSSVHRVQLDFKPSMEDELELRAGTLVRLLHEYDDGWVRPLFLCGGGREEVF